MILFITIYFIFKINKMDIYISFLGYNEKKITIETTLKNPDINLETIKLVPSSYLLDAIEISEEKLLVEILDSGVHLAIAATKGI